MKIFIRNKKQIFKYISMNYSNKTSRCKEILKIYTLSSIKLKKIWKIKRMKHNKLCIRWKRNYLKQNSNKTNFNSYKRFASLFQPNINKINIGTSFKVQSSVTVFDTNNFWDTLLKLQPIVRSSKPIFFTLLISTATVTSITTSTIDLTS